MSKVEGERGEKRKKKKQKNLAPSKSQTHSLYITSRVLYHCATTDVLYSKTVLPDVSNGRTEKITLKQKPCFARPNFFVLVEKKLEKI